MMVRVLPLEGEIEHTKLSTPVKMEHISNTPEPNNSLTGNTEIIAEPTEGRGKHIGKESELVRMLRDGTGVTGERNVLPKGVQARSMSGVVNSVEEEDYAMPTVIESAEGLMPTYHEARTQTDWPKWEEAIQKELESLKKSGTWELVECPKGANIVDC